MKRRVFIGLAVFIISMFISINSYAANTQTFHREQSPNIHIIFAEKLEKDVCRLVPVIPINKRNALETQNYLDTYKVKDGDKFRYRCSDGSFSLRFEIAANITKLPIPTPLIFNLQGDDNVRVSGLKLKQPDNDPVIFNINNPSSQATLYVDDVAFSGIVVENGNGHIEISKATIACADGQGVGVDIQGDNVKIKKSDISGCDEGVRISANNTLIGADSFENIADSNLIHNNKLGIHGSGTGNVFQYNSIFDNFKTIVDDEKVDDGILIDGNSPRPSVVLDPDTKDALHCYTGADGKITSREITFSVPEDGELTIYQTDLARQQGKQFLARCNVNKVDGKCIVNTLKLPDSIDGTTTCGSKDIFANALLTGKTTKSSTMYLPNSFIFDGHSSIISPTETGGPLAGPAGVQPSAPPDPQPQELGDIGGGGGSSGDSGGSSDDDGTITVASATGGGVVSGAGGSSIDSAAAGPSGAAISQKMGCSVADTSGLWWLIFLAPILYLLKKCYALRKTN